MAPSPTTHNATPKPSTAQSSAPLADYFFIAGIESSQIYDEKAEQFALPVEDIIEDIAESPTQRNRRSRYSFEARKSIGSSILGDATNGTNNANGTASNRSSVTIKAPVAEQPPMSDDAFEQALRQFASERDSFLDDVQLSAGVVPTPKKLKSITHRITSEDGSSPSGLKSGMGSVRKRLSVMSSMKRQSSVMSRQSSVLTSKRMSAYNSVIPAPAPFQSTSDMHPLKRRYEPVLLDRYPTKHMVDESKRRNPFPDYVPMFAFPNDVSVVSSDERPRSSWHGFAMTNQDNSKLHGVCILLWIPLNQAASNALERQCEEWRKANMSDEERELASSLGERLSAERAKLSQLLSTLPGIPSGSMQRERLEEEISSVEEKIALMTDLLRPLRHGAASKIEGLTEGDTGFWIPRAYGILGRDSNLTSFWKEWLKAVVVPMTNGAVQRVPSSSPSVGVWQPLERYVMNLCVEAPSPITSITQVEVALRELHLYARTNAVNELPGSRNTDLYALFRCLTIPNIITLFEYALAESRIIFVSSHTAMLQLACSALTSLLYPLKWTGVLIPILPARLIQALEAPCPYIAGVERRYGKFTYPDDDFCIVDLDENTIESTDPPVSLPRPQRRKLMALLQAAAPHHNRYGVPLGPPPYAIETFPNDSFCSENPQVFAPEATPSTLAAFVGESSTAFGDATPLPLRARASIFNAFVAPHGDRVARVERPSTSSTVSYGSGQSPTSSLAAFPASPTLGGSTVFSRNDSGLALHLREKRSGQLSDSMSFRNSSFGYDRSNTMRRPSAPILGHHQSMSTWSIPNGPTSSNWAPSIYAPSTLAASTVMPHMMLQPVQDDETTKWAEGHCLTRRSPEIRTFCAICDDKCDDEVFRCTGCGVAIHGRCASLVSIVCPAAFRADQVRAAFVRCFASLLYVYRKSLHPASGERRKAGLIYHFNMDQFCRNVPHGDSDYINLLRQTQAFNEFIHERETLRGDDPSIRLFDEIILSKRNRGKIGGLFSRSQPSFLSDTTDHLWRSASAVTPRGGVHRDPGLLTGRIPAKLDPLLMKEPRSIHGGPRLPQARARRKPVASMLGLSSPEIPEP